MTRPTPDLHSSDDNKRSSLVQAVVAIPVCNERHHIAACLRAFDTQCGLPNHFFGVVLFLNNCIDGTEDLIAREMPGLAYPLRVVVRDDPGASAGWARRRALEAAADWLDEGAGDDGMLLTTDADSRVPSDWIARNRSGLDAGADLVAGRLALDPDDAAALPQSLRARGALEAEYEALLIEIGTRFDPVPGDPWPTHACHSGASLATRLATYRRVGGMPDIPCGEDRAFVEAVLAHGGTVRHDPDIVVVTSGRLLGRAEGGVADTIKLRCDVPDSPCDDWLEPVGRVVARARLRRHLRHRSTTSSSPSGLPLVARDCTDTSFLWHPLRPSQLPAEIRRARLLLRLLSSSRGAPQVVAPVIPDRIAAAAFD